MIISMEYKILNEHECGSFKRNSSVAPLSPFNFFSLFSILFLFFVSSLALSIYLSFVLLGSFVLSSLGSFVCPLLGSFICHFWDLFLTLRATLYILQEVYKIFHTLQEVLNIRRMKTIMMYANVCLCQCSRICNDTSVSCSNYKGKAQLACDSSI